MSVDAHPIPTRHGFDHGHDPRLIADHRAEWNRLREESPVFRSDIAEGYSLWYLLRYDDNLAALQNWELFSSTTVQYLGDSPQKMIPEELDPPEHTKYRRVLSVPFAPKAVRAWEPAVRELCESLVVELKDRERIDLVRDFAQKFPTTIFLRIMGLPVEQCGDFIRRAHGVLNTTNEQDPDGSIRQAAAGAIVADLAALYAARRAEPRADLASELVAASIEGEPIDDDALYAMGFLLYLAGLDTVANLLGYAFRYLAENPQLRHRLREHHEDIPDAVEEFLRMYSLASGARLVTRDAEFAGCPMKQGDRILYVTAAAGRDPRQFEDPDEFRLDRASNRHLAFGAGPHRCVGSHLARLELQIALEVWHDHIPDYRITDGAVITEHVGSVAGLDTLPLTLG